jgi:hypothetical protein
MSTVLAQKITAAKGRSVIALGARFDLSSVLAPAAERL